MAADSKKLILGAVLLLGFCLVGDALAPGLRPHNDNKDRRWWWFHGGYKSFGASRKLLKPAGEVGSHMTTTRQVADTDRRQLSSESVSYKPNGGHKVYCALDPTCIIYPPPRRPPCQPYKRCRPPSP